MTSFFIVFGFSSGKEGISLINQGEEPMSEKYLFLIIFDSLYSVRDSEIGDDIGPVLVQLITTFDKLFITVFEAEDGLNK